MDEIDLEIEDIMDESENELFDCSTEEGILMNNDMLSEIDENIDVNEGYREGLEGNYDPKVNNVDIEAISTEELEDIDQDLKVDADLLEAHRTDNLVRDLLDQNVSKQRLLSDTKAEWSDPEQKGNSDCILKDDAEFNVNYKSTQEKVTYSGAEFKEHMKEKYGIDYVTYLHKEPDFSPFEQTFDKEQLESFLSQKYGKAVRVDEIPEGHITVEQMGTNRTDSYGEAYDYCLDVLAGGVTKKDLQEFMSKKDLTWHECGDRKTIRLVPSEINQVFAHTGGIGIEKDFESLQEELRDSTRVNDQEMHPMVLEREEKVGKTHGLEDAIEWRYERNKERKADLLGKHR